MKLIISGIRGTMGKVIAACIKHEDADELVGGYDHRASEGVVTSYELLPDADVIIDFSHPIHLEPLLSYALSQKRGLVIGTTGYTQAQLALIKEASKDIPIFYATNYSVGVYAMNVALAQVSSILETNFNMKLIDIHHIHKIDAPSGTAKTLLETIKTHTHHHPKVQVDSIREGEVVGIHEVIFENESEKVSVRHEAFSKEIFAKGALLAARFIHNKKSGLYDMPDLFKGEEQ